MKILITGGCGFIGSHLSRLLISHGHSVIVVDDLSTGSRDNVADIIASDQFRFVRANVENQTLMTPLVEQSDVVVHLAAAVGVQLIVAQPVHTLTTNIHGSEVMLELASTFGTKIIIASTSEVYGKNSDIPFSEDDDTTLGSTRFTRWSYACSKMVDEFLALAYHEQFALPAIICRLFNTIGPRQTGKYGMVVPRFVQAALRNEPIRVFGSGDQSRCFTNVQDVIGALEALIDCPGAIGEVINVGSQQECSINELARKIIEMTGSSSEVVCISYEEAYGRPFDDMLVRVPDLTKIRGLIGYEPKYSLEQTLRQIIEFERSAM